MRSKTRRATSTGGMLLGSVLVVACGLTDRRESTVHHDLQQKIASESQGAITLDIFGKTDGYDQRTAGLQLYVLEWQAQVSAQRELWKGGDAFAGYWQNFNVLPLRPVGFMAATWRRFRKGAIIRLTGQSTLLKTERGWRVQQFTVKASQVLNPGAKSLFDGVWRVAMRGTYLTIQEDDSGTFAFADLPYIVRDNNRFDAGLHLVDGQLEGTFKSGNFRATHGHEFDSFASKLAISPKSPC